MPPRTATRRDHSRPTLGGHVAAAAAAMGWPLLPWQRYAADVAHEIDPETGTFYYSTVLISVQRQAGKTTLDIAAAAANCLLGPGRRSWYTAQTGQHAGDKWRDQVDNYVMRSELFKHMVHPSYSNGAQALTFSNGSTHRPHPPTADSLHSKQSDRNCIDEAWAFDAVQGAALQQAITPTTTSRRKLTGHRPQLWIMSTEGTSESTYFNPKMDAARAGLTDDRTCVIDWGIPLDTALPDTTSPEDVERFLDVIWAHHPGAGHLFERDDLATWLADLGPAEFSRAYGNRRTGSTERVIQTADWNAAATSERIPDAAPIAFGAAAALDGASVSITATALLDDGRTITEVVDTRQGTAWAPARLKELQDRHGAAVTIDRFGPSEDLADKTEQAGVTLLPIRSRELSGACQALFSGVVHRDEFGHRAPPTWLHRYHPDLDEAVDGAAKRSIGDGAWVWGRRASTASVATLEAATLSTWAVKHAPAPMELQVW